MSIGPSSARTTDFSQNVYASRYTPLLSALSHENLTRWLYNTETRQISFSNINAAGLGFNEKQLPRSVPELAEIIHPDDFSSVREGILKTLAPGSVNESIELVFRCKNTTGEYIWAVVQGCTVGFGENKSAEYASGFLISQANLEEKLERMALEQERRLFAFEASCAGLWDWDIATDAVYYDSQYMKMVGFTAQDFPPVVDSWLDRIHEDDRDLTLHHQLAYIESPAHGDNFDVSYRFLAADNRYRWILGRGKIITRDENGRAKRVIGTHSDITELRTAQESLLHIVNFDSLTKLHSRWFFEKTCKELKPTALPATIMFIDIDGLKLTNDLMGHNVGDSLLIRTADLLRSTLRATDITARIGGDEFAVLMPNCSSHAAAAIAKKIQKHVTDCNAASQSVPIFLSIGTASTDSGAAFDTLLTAADEEMLRNKSLHKQEHHSLIRAWMDHHTERRICT